MKVIMKDTTLEMTVDEYVELQQIGNIKPENLTLQEEYELLGKLRHFYIRDTHWDSCGNMIVTLVRDAG